MLMNQIAAQIVNEETFPEILTPQALNFLEKLHLHFDEKRRSLLEMRNQINEKLNEEKSFQLLEKKEYIREGDWTVASLPRDLRDRRVEITGPVDRKMIIDGLNSGAQTFIADFEAASSPTWESMMHGQINLKDAIRRVIDFEGPNGKSYKLNEETAVLIVRPRGLHLDERNLIMNGKPMSASLVDFGLYLFHNAKELLTRGTGPYFYLPKVENHLEARFWNDVFVYSQNDLRIPQSTIKATVLIETVPAAFEMDEILYELQEHSAGLNCGRWDYLVSYIKKFHKYPEKPLPNRASVTMETPSMYSFAQLASQTCRKREAMAIGGMTAYSKLQQA